MNTIPLSSIMSGNQMQRDAITTSLIITSDPHLVVPQTTNGVPNPLFNNKKDGKSAIAVDICCLETPCDDIKLTTLKSVVAASTDFADFKSRIAAL
jgi:hypothetical protein